MGGFTLTASVSPAPFSFLSSQSKISCHFSPSSALFPSPSNFKFVGIRYSTPNGFKLRCSGNTGRGGSGSGDSDIKAVLDAFFLGKALAETLTERVESTIGEVLSGIGRLQAEQQKRILEFQEEVIERAKKAKDKAALDAIEGQGAISPSIRSPSTVASSPATNQQSSKPDTY